MPETSTRQERQARLADALVGPIPAGYTAYPPRPDIVICDTCIAADDNGNALVWRDEIASHEARLHPVEFTFFSTLAAAVERADAFANSDAQGDAVNMAEYDVVEAARALLKAWTPFDAEGMDKMVGDFLQVRRRNDARNAQRANAATEVAR